MAHEDSLLIDGVQMLNDFAALGKELKAKDKEIHDLKEQVASLQRALAHNRDRDSVVVG